MFESVERLITVHQILGFNYNTSSNLIIKHLMRAYNWFLVVFPIVFCAILAPYFSTVTSYFVGGSKLMSIFMFTGYFFKLFTCTLISLQLFFKGSKLVQCYYLISSGKEKRYVNWIIAITTVLTLAEMIFIWLAFAPRILDAIDSRVKKLISYAFFVMEFSFEYADCITISWVLLFATSYLHQIKRLTKLFDENYLTVDLLSKPIKSQDLVYKKLVFIKQHISQVSGLLSPGLIYSILNWAWNFSLLLVLLLSKPNLTNIFVIWEVAVLFVKLMTIGYLGGKLDDKLTDLVDRLEQVAVDNDWDDEAIDRLLMIKDLRDGIRFTASGFFDLKDSFIAIVLSVILQNVVIIIQTLPLIK